MGEYYPGEITIGGKVSAAVLTEFLSEVASAGASVGDYDGPTFGAKTVEELLKVLNEDGHLVLADSQASFGQFDELEAFCIKNDIPFDRHSDAHYEFDAVNVYFRPGMKHPAQVYSNNRRDDLMDADEVRTVAKTLARLVEAKASKAKVLAAVGKAARKLDKILPLEVEPLPPLAVT
jgi:hypothetical protein